MRVDVVKQDGSLIGSVAKPDQGLRLLQDVLALCREMKRDCIAEQIETERQIDIPCRLRCRYGQGFRLCPPFDTPPA